MTCPKCKFKILPNDAAIKCQGNCGNQFHAGCVEMDYVALKIITSISENDIIHLIDMKVTSLMCGFSKQLESFKSEISTKISQINANVNLPNNNPEQLAMKIPSHKQTFAQKLIGPSMSKILIQPKNQEQSSSSTENDILQSIDPISSNIKPIKNAKQIGKGGVILGYADTSHLNQIIKATESKFVGKYDIKELKVFKHTVKIVGMTVNVNENNLISYITKQNCELITNNEPLSLKKFWPTKKNPNIFQALVDLDYQSYNNLLNAGQVLIGLSTCSVYDGIKVLRCFQCNGFHHGKKFCKRVTSCPRCAAAHLLEKCVAPDSEIKCSNCIQLSHRFPERNINIEHDARNSNCVAFTEACQKLKTDLFELVDRTQ